MPVVSTGQITITDTNDAVLYYINTSADAISKDSPDQTTDGAHTPSSLTFTPYKAVGNQTPIIATDVFYTQWTSSTTEATTASPITGALTVNIATNADISSVTYRIYKDANKTTLLAEKIVPVVFKGATGPAGPSGVSINYTNDSLTVPQTATGVSTWTGSGGQLQVFEGTTLLTLSSNTQSTTTPATNGQYVLDITKVSGDTLTEPAITGAAGNTATIADWAGSLTTATVYRITAYIKTSTGSSVTVSTDVSISPSKAGADGDDAIVYYIATSSPVITKEAPNAATSGTHSSITIQGKKVVGATTTNFGWITITPNGGTESGRTDTASTPASLSPANADGKTSYTIKLYDAVSAGNLLDTETVNVVFKGEPGVNGTTPVVLDLSNDNITVPTDSNGNNGVFTSATSTITLVQGTTSLFNNAALTALSLTPSTGVTFSITRNGTTTTGHTTAQSPTLASLSTLSFQITALTQDSGTVTVSATVSGIAYTAEFTISKAKAGANGQPAVVYEIEADSEISYDINSDTYSPTTVTYTAYSTTGTAARTQFTTGTITLHSRTAEGSWVALSTGVAGTGATRTLTTNTALVGTERFVRATLEVGSVVVDQEIDAITISGTNGLPGGPGDPGDPGPAGANAVNVIFSNEAHVFPADAAGAVTSYANSGTQIRVYEGTTELTYDAASTANGFWKVTIGTASNITPGSITDSGTFATIGSTTAHSGVANGTDTSSIPYTITGKTANGTAFSIVKNQTFSKSKSGNPGAAGLSSRRAYTKSASATAPTPTAGTGDVVPTTSGLTWSFTIPTGILAAGEYIYQTDGLYNPTTNATSWSTAYLSNFKVGTLEALTTNTGNLVIGTTGSIKTTGSSFNGTGIFLGYDTNAYKFSVGLSGDNPRLSYDGTNLVVPQFTSIHKWKFTTLYTDAVANLQGWTLSLINANFLETGIELDSTGNDPTFTSPNNLNFSGNLYRKVLVRLRRKAGTSWDGSLFYTTAARSSQTANGTPSKVIPDPTVGAGGNWVIAEWDMTALTQGTNDWINGTIKQIRLDFGDTDTADFFEVDWIAIGRYASGSPDIITPKNSQQFIDTGSIISSSLGLESATVARTSISTTSYSAASTTATIMELTFDVPEGGQIIALWQASADSAKGYRFSMYLNSTPTTGTSGYYVYVGYGGNYSAYYDYTIDDLVYYPVSAGTGEYNLIPGQASTVPIGTVRSGGVFEDAPFILGIGTAIAGQNIIRVYWMEYGGGSILGGNAANPGQKLVVLGCKR